MTMKKSTPRLSGRGWNALEEKACPNNHFKRIVNNDMGTKYHINQDGWGNLMTGAGIYGIDKTQSTQFFADWRLQYPDLTQMYRSFGLGHKIIDRPCFDMYRRGFKIENDSDGIIQKALKKLNAMYSLQRATKWGRLYGGCLAVLGIDDGGEYWEPVNESRIKGIKHIHVFDRWRTILNTTDLYIDPTMDKYGKPEFYNIIPIYGAPFRVHESRTLRFEGADVSDQVRIQNQGWGDSELQKIYNDLKNLGSSYNNIATIIEEFILGVLTIENLTNFLIEGKEHIVRKRLQEMDLSKHINNTTLIDSNEKFERISATVTGLKDCIDTLAEAVSASSNIPICLLLGRSQGGLSDADGAQIRFYYDYISGEQDVNVLPQLTELVRLLDIAEGKPLGGNIVIESNPLHQPTEQEMATTKKLYMDMAVEAVDRGILYPEDVAHSFFGGDHYSSDIQLSDQHKKELDGFGFTIDNSGTPSVVTKNDGKTATNSFGKKDDMDYLGNLKTTDLKNLAKTFLPQNKINK